MWAPNAEQVFVTGTFNNFSLDAHPMTKDINGNWSTEIPEAKFGDQYKYRIINGDKDLFKNDPYAREVSN